MSRVGERVTYTPDEGAMLVGTIVPTEEGHPVGEIHVRWDNGNLGAFMAHMGDQLVPLELAAARLADEAEAGYDVSRLGDPRDPAGLKRHVRERETVGLLADELNQFAMQVEAFASSRRSEFDSHDPQREAYTGLFNAARRMREKIVGLIPE